MQVPAQSRSRHLGLVKDQVGQVDARNRSFESRPDDQRQCLGTQLQRSQFVAETNSGETEQAQHLYGSDAANALANARLRQCTSAKLEQTSKRRSDAA